MAQLKWQQAGVPPHSGFSLLSLWYVGKSDVYVVIVHLYFFLSVLFVYAQRCTFFQLFTC